MGKGGWEQRARSTFRLVHRLRGRKIDENRARQETRRWTGAARVAREEWMEEDDGGRQKERERESE